MLRTCGQIFKPGLGKKKLFPRKLPTDGLMADRCITFRTDNAGLVDIINQQTSKHKLVMTLVRDPVLTSLQHNIIFQAKHIEGIHYTLADHLSRFQLDKFQELYPGVDPQPPSVNESLLLESCSLTLKICLSRPFHPLLASSTCGPGRFSPAFTPHIFIPLIPRFP